ncbi:MAG: PilT/PilU family type 4a pilus ATPase [Acidimicrobiia bacterium]|nr:PilT/PilU family type 4a pilus ATPase [Acidimicrobiia bacterium]
MSTPDSPPQPVAAAVRPVAVTRRGLVADLLDATVAVGASDLHVTPGSRPIGRRDGAMIPLGEAVWGQEATEAFCRALCSEAQWAEVEASGTTDFGVSHGSGNRFRASVLRHRHGYGAVLRRISNELLRFDEIGFPEAIVDVLRRPRGLVLVTGPTGAGKSTTLATMVDWINTNLDRHIVTIEDPVEFYHRHKKSLITQREIGVDVPDFPEAMRRVLRQDPDVILVGEMRDLETISAAVTAAETGHLVLATLHTTGSATTVSRIIDVFPTGQQAQIRVQLAMSLAAVISQVLVPARGVAADGPGYGGRVAALEIMLMTPAIANLIRNNEINRINDVMQTSRHLGMIRLDDHLARLVEDRRIDKATAIAVAQDPAALQQRIGS